MTDFILTFEKNNGNLSKEAIAKIGAKARSIKTVEGDWGMLTFTDSLFPGFNAYNYNSGLFFILGAPFWPGDGSSQRKMSRENDNYFTQALFQYYCEKGEKAFEEFDGPFLFLHVDFKKHEILIVTDKMSFIPVYIGKTTNGKLGFSTHVDALAKTVGMVNDFDLVSLGDLLCHGTVCFPYTTYKDIKQLAPATMLKFSIKNQTLIYKRSYWQPTERRCEGSLMDVATIIRNGLAGYMDKIVSRYEKLRIFLSGGEDSRLIAAILSKKAKTSGMVIADGPNREEKLAREIAGKFSIPIKSIYRCRNHYINILHSSSALLGTNHAYVHGHFVGLEEKIMKDYSGIFLDGLFADMFLKGSRINKIGRNMYKNFVILPDMVSDHVIPRPSRSISKYLDKNLAESIAKRWAKYSEDIRNIRPNSWMEWLELWPISQNHSAAHFFAERRQFPLYGLFACNCVLVNSCKIPQRWKINRRLFREIAKPYFKPIWYMSHTDYHLPYFPWYINWFIQDFMTCIKYFRKIFSGKQVSDSPLIDNGALCRQREVRHIILRSIQALRDLKLFDKSVDNNDLLRTLCSRKDIGASTAIQIANISLQSDQKLFCKNL